MNDSLNDEHTRQVQGLYAGIILLNELEPQVDHGMSSISHAFFAYGYLHQGMLSDFSEKSTNNLDLDESTVDNPRGLFQNLQPDQPTNEPSESCMSEASWWDPFMQEFTSRFLDERPKAPNVWFFLCQLRPTSAGEFSCRDCRNYVHEVFPASRDRIRNRFRYYRIDGNFKLVDLSPGKTRLMTAVDSIVAGDAYQRKIRNLLLDCNRQYEIFQEAQRTDQGIVSDTTVRTKWSMRNYTIGIRYCYYRIRHYSRLRK